MLHGEPELSPDFNNEAASEGEHLLIDESRRSMNLTALDDHSFERKTQHCPLEMQGHAIVDVPVEVEHFLKPVQASFDVAPEFKTERKEIEHMV